MFLVRYFNTIKYLKFKQILYRIYYKLGLQSYSYETNVNNRRLSSVIIWKNYIYETKDCHISNYNFKFLNRERKFKKKIDWNYNKYGKLWSYNLNYFNFLNQKNINLKTGLKLINDYIDDSDKIKVGFEPYPMSLRGINWIKFLSKHKIKETRIDNFLFHNYNLLSKNIEYHILGNHILENAFSLFFASCYFKNEKFYKISEKLIFKELNEQILDDGAHFELSPMYHQIILYRILDCLNLSILNNYKCKILENLLREKASLMLTWLNNITFNNGSIPMVNDSSHDIAPLTKQLNEYAQRLELKLTNINLSKSGYRMYKTTDTELFIDVGEVKSNYQPGHTHSDIFNFILYYKNNPVIIDTGVTTYDVNLIRFKERGVESHNTVMIDKKNQIDVWNSFRLGKRAKIFDIEEKKNFIIAKHNGYLNLGIYHTRSFSLTADGLVIADYLEGNNKFKKVAIFHFHYSIKKLNIVKNLVYFQNIGFIKFEGKINSIKKYNYNQSLGFNKPVKAHKIEVDFKGSLTSNFIFLK